MAVYGLVESVSKTAGADLTADRYRAVKNGANDTVTLCTTPNGGLSIGPIGVLQQVEASGRAVAVGISGLSKLIAGDTVTVGKGLTVNSAANAVHAGSGDVVFAIADEGAADGEVFRARLVDPYLLVGLN